VEVECDEPSNSNRFQGGVDDPHPYEQFTFPCDTPTGEEAVWAARWASPDLLTVGAPDFFVGKDYTLDYQAELNP
jgi:hypothetical protein